MIMGEMMPNTSATLLCVANYPANTGYAWNFIESLYARIADHMAEHGIRTLVAYPEIRTSPSALAGSAAQAILLNGSLETLQSVRTMVELIRRQNIRVVYFTDRPAWRWAYVVLRWAGVRRIIVHDHTSGERTAPRGAKRVAKFILSRVPGMVADVVIAVSEYVARRHREVGLIPASRVVTVWNGLPIVEAETSLGGRAHKIFGLAPDRPLIVCACRATAEKGVGHLLRAFDHTVRATDAGSRRPVLLYVGDGPQLAELRALRDCLAAKDDIILAGYRGDAAAILECADLCVVPSVWQEAFPLAVLEAMARGKPVIASSVGGIPELIEDGVTGLLVPPMDEEALAEAVHALLADPARGRRLAQAARQRVADRFTPKQQLHRLTALLEEGFGQACTAVRG